MPGGTWITCAQTLRRHQVELERLQRRQEVMYDDRLDGRVDAATYDQRILQIRVQREQIQQRVQVTHSLMPPLAAQALDLRALTSRIAESFSEQPAAEQRKLLRVLVQQASWKNGELQMSLREPFAALRVAKRAATSEHPGRRDQELPTRTPANGRGHGPQDSSREGDWIEAVGERDEEAA